MQDNFIITPKTAQIKDEFALEADKKKAYQIFTLSALLGGALTAVMYLLTQISI